MLQVRAYKNGDCFFQRSYTSNRSGYAEYKNIVKMCNQGLGGEISEMPNKYGKTTIIKNLFDEFKVVSIEFYSSKKIKKIIKRNTI